MTNNNFSTVKILQIRCKYTVSMFLIYSHTSVNCVLSHSYGCKLRGLRSLPIESEVYIQIIVNRELRISNVD